MDSSAVDGANRKTSLTVKIMIGWALGAVVGMVFSNLDSAFINTHIVDGLFAMAGKMFVSAVQMLVVPLVVFSLLCGVTGIGDLRVLGRVGGKSFGLYVITTVIAIAVAIVLALQVDPGAGFDMAGVDASDASGGEVPTIWEVLATIVPTNPIAALAEGKMLQIIFYVVVLGIAALMLGDRSAPFVQACEYMAELMMRVLAIVATLAPYGIFCLMAKTFAEQGIELFVPVITYVGVLVGSLALHLFVTLMILLKVLSGLDPFTFMRKLRPAQLFAFSTASSYATIPVTLRCVTERMGAENSVASFTVPCGATINMDGTAIMQGVATVFLANVYGVDLGLGGYLTVIAMVVLASIGTGGVPSVGLVMLTMVLTEIGVPIEGIAIIVGVDRLLDMIRTAVNITGDAAVTAIVAKSEGKLDLAVYGDLNAGVFARERFEVDQEKEVRPAAAT